MQETQEQYAYLSVTYRHNDNYTDIYDAEMANCCQKFSQLFYIFYVYINTTRIWRAVVSIFFLNSNRSGTNAARLIFRTCRSAHATHSLHSLYWTSTEQRIEYKLTLLCFKIISHQVPIYIQTVSTFTLLPGSSALLQTPECLEYHISLSLHTHTLHPLHTHTHFILYTHTHTHTLHPLHTHTILMH